MKKCVPIVRGLAVLAAVGLLVCGLLCGCDKAEKKETLVPGIISGDYEYTRSEGDKTARISSYKGAEATVEIPKTLDNLPVTEVEQGAFAQRPTLKQVVLPASVKKIGSGAFKNCTSLNRVKLGDEVTEIGDYAFSGCFALTAISLPDTVQTIGSNAFSGCTALEKMIIGKGVSHVGIDAFYGTKWFASLSDEFVIVGDGVLIDYNGKTTVVKLPEAVKHIATAFVNNTAVQSVTLPKGIAQVDSHAFQGCVSLHTVELPDSVKAIGDYAFARCMSLQKLNLTEAVESIGRDAFSGCISLRDLTIPKSIKTLPERAFAGCSNLSRITLPKELTAVEKDAFLECGAINVVVFNGPKSAWNKITIAGGNEVFQNAILNCTE